MALTVLTATIPAGQSLSSAANYNLEYVVGIVMPTAWTNAHVTVQMSVDGVKYYDLFSFDDLSGSTTAQEFKFNVVPGALVVVDPQRSLAGRYLKLRSGTRNAPVPQEAARVFTIITNTKAAATLLPAEQETA